MIRVTRVKNDAPGAGPFKGMTVYDADETGQKLGVTPNDASGVALF